MSSNCKKLIAESDSESEPEIYINKEYAEKYENWRKKEEYQKLKSKYGENVLSESSEFSGTDSESDSDQDLLEEQLNQEVFDEDFLRVYGALKSKDPRIYDEKFTFVNKSSDESSSRVAVDAKEAKREKSTKKMNLVDYHMKLMREREGVTEEDIQDETVQEISNDPGYYEKLGEIKEGFKKIIDHSDSESEDDILKAPKSKAAAEKSSKATTDKPLNLLENTNDRDIVFLKDYWNREDVDDSEKFIRDFILKKKYLDRNLKVVSSGTRVVGSSKDDTACFFGNMPQDDEPQDEKDTEKQTVPIDGSAKFRFQEEGATEIKRYPRVMDSARDLSSKDERAAKRKEKREAKKKEKEEDLMRFTQLKREQERERIRKLIEASKNRKLDETDPNLEKLVDETHEFDPEQYDSMMKKLYDNDYYKEGEVEDEKKPAFEFIAGIDDVSEESDDDDEAESAPDAKVDEEINPGDSDYEEDDEELKSLNCRKRRRVRKKKLRERLRKAKDLDSLPDYEDVIGKDLPVRFKYRQVIPNDFGLSVEEILLADDKDLNRWASLKTTVAFRDDSEEQRDIKRFNSKRNDLKHKQKILKSLFREDSGTDGGKKKKRRAKKKAIVTRELPGEQDDHSEVSSTANGGEESVLEKGDDDDQQELPQETSRSEGKVIKKKSRKRKRPVTSKHKSALDVDRLKAYGFSKTEMKKRKLI